MHTLSNVLVHRGTIKISPSIIIMIWVPATLSPLKFKPITTHDYSFQLVPSLLAFLKVLDEFYQCFIIAIGLNLDEAIAFT